MFGKRTLSQIAEATRQNASVTLMSRLPRESHIIYSLLHTGPWPCSPEAHRAPFGCSVQFSHSVVSDSL